MTPDEFHHTLRVTVEADAFLIAVDLVRRYTNLPHPCLLCFSTLCYERVLVRNGRMLLVKDLFALARTLCQRCRRRALNQYGYK